LHPDGFIGGGQFGYNLQSNVWLFGFETDFQGSAEEDSSGRLVGVLGPCTVGTCTYFATSNVTARLNWFGTVRGRVGLIWDGWLIYATGGFAYGEVSLTGRASIAETNVLNVFIPFRFDASTVATGGAVGGGIERTTWWNNVTWRVEYLYLDFGSVGERFNGGRVSTDFTDNIVRFGLNIKLSTPPP